MKKPDPRQNVTLRLSAAERAQLEAAAAQAGRKPSDFARDRLLGGTGHAAPAAVLASEGQRVISALLAVQLQRVGVNLNQLVRHVHQHPDERVPADAALILGQIRELVRQARAL